MSGEDDPVRALHNAVAASANQAEASTRPVWTTDRELRRMVEDVLTKLEIDSSTSALEIGCGVGVLAVPIAHRVARFVGIDFAEQALAVLEARLDAEGLSDRTELVRLDLLRASSQELGALGKFDRILVYATLHYVADEAELDRFLDRSLDLLMPGGLVLFGNVPLAELRDGGDGPVPRPPGWKVRALAYRAARRAARAVRRQPPFRPSDLRGGTTLPLRASMIDGWLSARSDVAEHRWLAPRVGTPLFGQRGDLVVRKR
jgi:predicted O-methyltransferase YrrM